MSSVPNVSRCTRRTRVPDRDLAAEQMAIAERPVPDSLGVKLLCRTAAQIEHQQTPRFHNPLHWIELHVCGVLALSGVNARQSSNVQPGKRHLPRPSSGIGESRLVTKIGWYWIPHLSHTFNPNFYLATKKPQSLSTSPQLALISPSPMCKPTPACNLQNGTVTPSHSHTRVASN
ncbi:hypothetical protein NA56DRAFT_711276 [Hyaloscypha hepaticicola]|uniref:Uncharacterized protein n=1 Tax=Hyaloscypha hepaticicola TaxID=2082293 RepID=A0A2J6PJH7_9HELO|nr:hypothetical protein NA56DRAFT_711276 [Hyaloscypha hepaticicola]